MAKPEKETDLDTISKMKAFINVNFEKAINRSLGQKSPHPLVAELAQAFASLVQAENAIRMRKLSSKQINAMLNKIKTLDS